MSHRAFSVPLPSGPLALGRAPMVMGVVNVTPDSFSDGGDNADPMTALASARRMVGEGAAIIDVGGESTRPGADEVGTATELARVMPVIEALAGAKLGAILSIDTNKAEVARQALAAGAEILNDVHGLQSEPELAGFAAESGAAAVAMHWDPVRDEAKDVIGEIKRYFEKSIGIAEAAGLPRNRLMLDPGFGFAKTFAENYEILHRLDEIAALGYPLLVGMSRKSMLGRLLGTPPKERLAGTVATSVIAWQKGAHIFRVHDVRANLDGLRVAMAAAYGPPAPAEA